MSKVRAIFFYELLAVLLVLALTSAVLFVEGSALAGGICFVLTFTLGSAIVGTRKRFDFSRDPSATQLPSSTLRSAAILAAISLAGAVFVVLEGLDNGGIDLLVGLIGGAALFLMTLLMAAAAYFGRRLP